MYYADRPNKREMISRQASESDKHGIVVDFMNGMDPGDIASKYNVTQAFVRRTVVVTIGQDEYDNEVNAKREISTAPIPGKITADMIPIMVNLYRNGNTLDSIADKLPRTVSASSILKKLKSLPDWLDIRMDYEKNRKRRLPAKQATTRIYRPGTIGNLRSKGPSSRHTSGMFPSAKWGMYKP